jgi:hypothetical protein
VDWGRSNLGRYMARALIIPFNNPQRIDLTVNTQS